MKKPIKKKHHPIHIPQFLHFFKPPNLGFFGDPVTTSWSDSKILGRPNWNWHFLWGEKISSHMPVPKPQSFSKVEKIILEKSNPKVSNLGLLVANPGKYPKSRMFFAMGYFKLNPAKHQDPRHGILFCFPSSYPSFFLFRALSLHFHTPSSMYLKITKQPKFTTIGDLDCPKIHRSIVVPSSPRVSY